MAEQHYSRTRRRAQRPAKKKKSWLKRSFLTLITLAVLGVIGGIGAFAYYAKSAPSLTTSKLQSTGSTIIYDASGNKVTSLGTQNRIYASSNDIPQKLKNAIVSIEDRRFYKHRGVDPYRTLSAAVADLLHRSASGLQGGSTLDQQLIKLAYFSTSTADQNLRRKAQEAWLALKLDRKYSKNQILTFYINKVYMGYGTYGMQTAANYYYGKTLKQLDLAQTALIAGLPNAPSAYNPYTNPTLAKKRRDKVLDAMVTNKKITKAQAAAAKKESITTGLVKKHSTNTTQKAKWADAYIKQVIAAAKAKGYNPYSGSLKIYTNLNMKAQKRLYQIANTSTYVSYPNKRLQVASTIVNPNNGAVVDRKSVV